MSTRHVKLMHPGKKHPPPPPLKQKGGCGIGKRTKSNLQKKLFKETRTNPRLASVKQKNGSPQKKFRTARAKSVLAKRKKKKEKNNLKSNKRCSGPKTEEEQMRVDKINVCVFFPRGSSESPVLVPIFRTAAPYASRGGP